MAVHIPFYIGNFGAVENFSDVFDYVVSHFGHCEVQYQLISSETVRAVRVPHGILGVRSVKLAVFIHAFGLEPKTELKAHCRYLFCERAYAAGKFFKVYVVVAEARHIVVAGPEPAVVENKEFDTQLFARRARRKRLRRENQNSIPSCL